MFLNKRQANFVMDPNYANEKIELAYTSAGSPPFLGVFEKIPGMIMPLLIKKVGGNGMLGIYAKDRNSPEDMMEDCIRQTINYLRRKELLNLPPEKGLTGIKELWKNFIDLGPAYEGMNLALRTALTWKHFPGPAKAMSEGNPYDFWPLSQMQSAIEFTLEYLKKEGLLKEPVPNHTLPE